MGSRYIEKDFSPISVNTVQTKQSETMKGEPTSELRKMNKQEKNISKEKKTQGRKEKQS